MPRTLDATLLAAMNAGGFTPYFNVQLLAANRSTVVFQTTEVTGFTLDGLTAKVSFHDDAYVNNSATFRIQRGVMIAGVPNIVTSSQFYPSLDRYTKRIRSLEGHVFPISFYSSTGDVSYGSIIATICAAYGLGVAYDDGGAAWISYQFYPTGRTFTLNDARQFFIILRQKYLVFATDNCNDELFFFQAKAVGPTYPAGYASVYPGLATIPGLGSYKIKSFLSRDENNTTHTSGDAGSPLHNLGFLPSTAVHPDCDFYFDSPDWFVTDISPNLKYRDFDALKVVFDNSVLALWPSRVREIFDKKLHPSWQWNCKYLDIFANTEGGAIPSSIEAAAPYTPINVTNFDKNLNSTVNNLQALADRVDELDTGPSIAASTALNPPLDTYLFPVVDMSLVTPKVKNITWLQIKTDLNDQSLRPTLSADRHYHVRVDGNDANDGLSDSAGRAFLTLQRAINVAAGLDCGVYNIQIYLGAGTYVATSTTFRNIVGSGTVTIEGDLGTPANVIIDGRIYKDTPGTIYRVGGVKFQKSASSATNAITILYGAVIQLYTVIFGTGYSYHCNSSFYSIIDFVGDYEITGGCVNHFYALYNGSIRAAGITITVTGTPAFTTFAYALRLGLISCFSTTINGAATGKKYDSILNSLIWTNGAGINLFPGNVAGTTATGGQYA